MNRHWCIYAIHIFAILLGLFNMFLFLHAPWPLSKASRGRKRKVWAAHASFDIGQEEHLKDAARRWLLQQEVSHKLLIPTTKEKRRAFLATCASCQNCNSQYCFSLADEKVVVEKTGESVGPPNLKKIKLTNAKKYGASSSPFCCFEANVEGQSPGRPKTYSGPAEESKAKLQVTEVFGRASGLSWRPQAVRRLSSTWGGGAHRTHGPYQGLCALAFRVCCD